MSATQIHLMLNHVPVLLSIVGGVILLFGLLKKNNIVINTSLYLLIAAALFTLPVYFTGEGTEESIEHLPWVTENMIERHENMATIAFVLIGITGIIALISYILRKRTVMSFKIAMVALLFAFVSFGAFAQTAHLGGKIRHTELGGNSVQNVNTGKPPVEQQRDKGGDD